MKMKNLKITLIAMFLLAFVEQLQAQKNFYNTQEEVIEAAYKTLDNWMESGELKEAIEKKLEKYTGESSLTGTFIYDITIRNKGEVASVFKVESDAPIKVQNHFKDCLKALQFPFKMPKNKSYKFRYEFKF
jgi:hypothetical protein